MKNDQEKSSLLCCKVRFLGQNPKIGYQEFNDLQIPKLSKKQLCDRTTGSAPHVTNPESRLTAQGGG
jgi:hypothetical protein